MKDRPMNDKYPFWPRIEHMRGQLTTVVDSLMIAFFLNRDQCDDPGPAERAFAEFFGGIGHNKLHFFVDEEGYTEPLPATPMSIVQEYVVEQTVAGEIVDLVLLDTEQPGNRCQARYFHDPTISNPKWPDKKSFIWFRVSQDMLLQGGMDEVLSFVDLLSGFLPYSYGYVSPALSYGHFFSDVLPYIRRYPGFDVVSQAAVASDLNDRPLGAYWVNIFGPRLSDTLGGLDALRAMLPKEARVSPCGGEGTRVVLDQAPDVGDVNRGHNLPLYRALAATLRPHMRVPQIIYFEDEYGMADRAAQEAWHNRLFDD